MKHYLHIAIIVFIGGLLRFVDLSHYPLFIDESLFALWVREPNPSLQEFLPIYLGKLLGLSSEAELRGISAFFGTASIFAIWLVAKENKHTLAWIVCVFPLFLFWSRMARPYAPAIFFMIMAWYDWKNKYMEFVMMFLALLCTPISAVGLRITRKRWYLVPIVGIIALAFFMIRPDSDSDFINAIKYASRWATIPAMVILLYLSQIKQSLWTPYEFKKGIK